ncbi:MAG: hypothetical protein ACREJV_04345 [Candidatus Rokuibacteriota bacterium]
MLLTNVEREGAMTTQEIHARFRQVVARGIAKAEAAEREHLARIREGRLYRSGRGVGSKVKLARVGGRSA